MTYNVTTYLVNDDCNYFDEWQKDRKTYGIGDDCFSWSPDDPMLDNTVTLTDPEAREIYNTQLRDKYIECAKLTPVTTQVTAADGFITLDVMLDAGNVIFWELTPVR